MPALLTGCHTPRAMIRALIYDFDDTIVESERINDGLFAAYMSGVYGIDLSKEEQDYLYGFAWSGVFDWLRANRGLRATRAEAWDGFLEAKRRHLEGIRLKTATGLERMLTLPVPRAIVSGSTRPEILMMMENAGLTPGMVDFMLTDEDCPRGKPDPQGFQMALERLGVAPGDAFVFEDSGAGIRAAKAAGIPVAFVAELASRDAGSTADHRFASFVEAYPWIRDRIAPPSRP